VGSNSSLHVLLWETERDKGKAYFGRAEYAAAAGCWSSAIALLEALDHDTAAKDPTSAKELAILYTNRSLAWLKLDNFNAALDDGKVAHEFQPNWSRPLLRTAHALIRLGRMVEAEEEAKLGKNLCVDGKEGVEKEQEFNDLLQREIAVARAKGSRKLQEFLSWLVANGAQFPSVELRAQSSDYRDVCARRSISARKPVIEIPFNLLITSELVLASCEVSKQALAAGVVFNSHQSHMALYLLQERGKMEASFWFPYLRTLPRDYGHMYTHFGKEELELLKNTSVEQHVIGRRNNILMDFRNVCAKLPDVHERYSEDDYVWAHTVVLSRVFSCVIKGANTEALVPMADMLNHAAKPNTAWGYDEKKSVFSVLATTGIEVGADILDSYGQKDNMLLFTFYGFALEHNPANTVELAFIPRGATPQDEKKLLDEEKGKRTFRITACATDPATNACFRFLRSLSPLNQGVNPHHRGLAPALDSEPLQSLESECTILQVLAATSQGRLHGYSTTHERDTELLSTPGLVDKANHRSCIIFRRGEKLVFQSYIDLYNVVVHLRATKEGSKERKQAWKKIRQHPTPNTPYIEKVFKRWLF